MSIRSKRSTTRSFAAVIAAALIASLLALVAGPASAVTPLNKSSATSADGRVSGDDRYGTATAAASSYLTRRGSLTSWNRVVVVSGDNFPDALSAASLAGSYTAPIILMPSDGSLPTVVKEWGLTKRDQIQANSTAAASFKFVIVGGTSAVPDAGVQALLDVVNAGDLTPATMTRISGANRAATAKAVATQTNAAGSYTILAAAKEIFVANEASFADAMAIAPYAFNAAAPVLLTGKDSLGADALAVLKTYKTLGGTKVKVLGGTAAVSDQVIQDIVINGAIPLSSIGRIFGADRYATSVAIQNYVDTSSVNASNFDASHVVMVNGQNFADGLAAAPYAGHGTGGAARLMYLTEASGVSSSVSAKMTTHAKSDFPTNVYAVGGTSAVSADVIAGVTTAAQALNTTSTLTCVENSTATSVTLTVPGNISGATSAGYTWLGDEANLILNGSLTINGSSNTSNASTAMVETFHTTGALKGNTTLVGLVPAGTLAKGTVITWSGLSELANASVAKRTIAGSTCTVADDKVGPTATIDAQIGATGFHVDFSEKVTGFDCTDITATIAAFNATANVGCGTIDQGLTAANYRVASLFEDLNNDGELSAAITLKDVTDVSSADVLTLATHGFSVGDKIVCDVDTLADDGTYFVRTVPSATTITTSATYGGALDETWTTDNSPSNDANVGCTRTVEQTYTITAGDSIVVDTRAAAAPTAVTNVQPVTTAGAVGGTVTSAAHGLAVGDKITLNVDASADDGTYEVLTVADVNTFTVKGSVALTADNAQVGATVSKYWVNDLSNNAGTTQTTKTMNAVNDADVTKPILSVALTCVQGAEAVLSNGTTLKATAHSLYGPQGVAGNTYKMYVVNNRVVSLPSVVVDDTAATITITADLAYTSVADVQAAYANAGGVAWSFTFAAAPATAATAIGTASATTAATPIKSSGGHTGDVVGAQSCTAKVTSNEYLQEMSADGTTAVAAINGVATAFSANDGTSDALADGWKTITFDGVLAAWTLPIADGTTTITLNGSNIKDMKGNVVTNLALVD